MRKKLIRTPFFVLVVFALLGDHQVLCQEYGQPFISNFSPLNYNGGPQNWCVAQDSKGIVYIGNSSGVLQYDGTSYRSIGSPNRSAIRSLAIDDRDVIYAGAKGDFGVLSPNEKGQLYFKSFLPLLDSTFRDFSDVWDIHLIKDKVYFSSYKYLFCYDGRSLHVIKPANIFGRAFKVHDKLYVEDRQTGLLEVDGSKLKKVLMNGPYSLSSISFVLALDNDRLLLGSPQYGLLVLNDGTLTPFKTDVTDALIDAQIYRCISLPNGDFAIGTLREGLFIIDRNGVLKHKFDKDAGIRDNTVTYLFVDQQGGLWMALSNGLTRIELSSPFTAFDESSGVDGIITSISRHQGKLYIGTIQGLQCLVGWNSRTNQNDLSTRSKFESVEDIKTQVWHLLPSHGKMLVATSVGVYELDKSSVKLISKRLSFFLHRSISDSNRIYIGTNDGMESVYRVKNGWVEEEMTEDIHEEIRTIAQVDDQELWLGTAQKGVIKMTFSENSSRVEKFGTANGLPGGYVHVYPLEDRVTFSTYDGIYTFDQDKNNFVPDTKFGLNEKQVSQIIEGFDKDFYMISALEHNTKVNHGYTSSDSIYAYESNLFLRIPQMDIYGLLIEENGTTWLGGTSGLVRYDGGMKKIEEKSFSTLIREVNINRDSIIYGGHSTEASIPVLEHRYNNLRFHFAATSFDAQDKNQYKYLLAGFDKKWSNWTYDIRKEYTNIPAGTYVFRVKAKNVYNFESQEASYQFEIKPPWYQTTLAYLIYGAIILYIFVIIARANAQRLTRANLALEKVVWDRTKEITQKNLQLKEQRDEILKQKDALDQIAQELRAANNEITSINSNLEVTIEDRTTEIRSKNAQLLNYAFSNAHKVRGPLSRIMGLIQLINIEKATSEDLPLYLGHIQKSAEELDIVIKEINKRLEDG